MRAGIVLAVVSLSFASAYAEPTRAALEAKCRPLEVAAQKFAARKKAKTANPFERHPVDIAPPEQKAACTALADALDKSDPKRALALHRLVDPFYSPGGLGAAAVPSSPDDARQTLVDECRSRRKCDACDLLAMQTRSESPGDTNAELRWRRAGCVCGNQNSCVSAAMLLEDSNRMAEASAERESLCAKKHQASCRWLERQRNTPPSGSGYGAGRGKTP